MVGPVIKQMANVIMSNWPSVDLVSAQEQFASWIQIVTVRTRLVTQILNVAKSLLALQSKHHIFLQCP